MKKALIIISGVLALAVISLIFFDLIPDKYLTVINCILPPINIGILYYANKKRKHAPNRNQLPIKDI